MQYSPGLLFDERYLFEKFLGSGSFGEVWLAKDKATDLDVAIKIYISMDSAGLSEFRKEFQLSFELNHTNLLHANYLGVSVEDNRPYLVMPFCPKGSVSKFAGKMNEAEMWRFIRDVAAGLAFLHDQTPPIIHQDIKPDNILILKNGNYVISDFGISKQLKSSMRKSAHLNSAGAVAYMGPERFSKQYHAVKASDIWSFGVTIYELIMEDLPFCGMGGSMQKQGADIPDLPEEFSKEMQILYTSCLAKETWDRPSAAQICEYAEACMQGKKPEITWNYQAEESVNSTQTTVVEASNEQSAAQNNQEVQSPESQPLSGGAKIANQTVFVGGNAGTNATVATVTNGENSDLPPIIGEGVPSWDKATSGELAVRSLAWWWYVLLPLLSFVVGVVVQMFVK
jgi:serine/threonine protein kinase